MKITFKKLIKIFLIIVTLTFVSSIFLTEFIPSTYSIVFAEDDDDEDEDEEHEEEEHEEDEEDEEDEDDEDDEDDDEYEDDYDSGTSEGSVSEELIESTETVVVPVQVVTIDPAFTTDTDGDELVDALDPDPYNHQKLYFTDSDDDGIPDISDMHPGENDFYFTQDLDENDNGIADSIEQ